MEGQIQDSEDVPDSRSLLGTLHKNEHNFCSHSSFFLDKYARMLKIPFYITLV